MALNIKDGYTLEFRTQGVFRNRVTKEVEADNLPVVCGRYRPATFKEIQEFEYKYARAQSGEEQAKVVAQMIASHIVDWDVTSGDEAVKVEAAVITGPNFPGPVALQLLDIVMRWAPAEQDRAAGNSSGG